MHSDAIKRMPPAGSIPIVAVVLVTKAIFRRRKQGAIKEFYREVEDKANNPAAVPP